jgi:hypothetical protein
MKSIIALGGAAALAFAGPALADRGHGNGHGRAHHSSYGYGYAEGCPHGLAKKHNGCMPPGQARRLARGERWQSGYGTLYSYNRIPYDVRRQYGLNTRYRYYYDNGNLYAVDPRTMLVQQVISSLMR